MEGFVLNPRDTQKGAGGLELNSPLVPVDLDKPLPHVTPLSHMAADKIPGRLSGNLPILEDLGLELVGGANEVYLVSHICSVSTMEPQSPIRNLPFQ